MRRLSWVVILFQFAWLNVIVPGHVRGCITVPAGSGASQTVCGSCCRAKAAKTPAQHAPTPDERQRCAICYVSAGYTLPPIFTIDLKPSGTTFLTQAPVIEQVASLALPRTYDANAPPGV